MKISLVMSVYDGSKYLEPQLDSIKNQSRCIDEVLIFDDVSKDNSFQLIKDYIKKNGLNSWSVFENPQNYGWKKNFYNGIKACTGDIIFTCDQDDIWVTDKIETMANAIETNSHIQLLIADQVPFYYDDLPQGLNTKTRNVSIFKTGDHWKYIQRPGCVFAFTKELQKKFVSCWRENYAHDLLLWQLAAIEDTLYHIDYDAIYFRRHDNNATPANKRTLDNRLKLSRQSLAELNDLKRFYELQDRNDLVKKIEASIEFEHARIAFLVDKGFSPIKILRLVAHHQYYLKPYAWGIDLLCKIKR